VRVFLLRLAGRLWLAIGFSCVVLCTASTTQFDNAGLGYIGLGLLVVGGGAGALSGGGCHPPPVAVRVESKHLRLAQPAAGSPQRRRQGHRQSHLATMHLPLVTGADRRRDDHLAAVRHHLRAVEPASVA
jgi:hypothetical protein